MATSSSTISETRSAMVNRATTFHDLEGGAPYTPHAIPLDNRPGWHPKISPYRLLVIVTTIVFGTAKSVAARSGHASIPTTLEWVAGTLFFLIFFSISSYESPDKSPPKYLSWLFEPDCLDAIWFLLERLAMKRPMYSSKEKINPYHSDLHTSNHPALTHYRLLVVLTVTSFGLSKAELAYSGKSGAMNWVEWAMAVPITTIFYILGLYEYNDSNLWPSFFVADRKLGLSIGLRSTFGVAFSLVWVAASTYALHYNWFYVDWVSDRPDYTKVPIVSTTRASVYLAFYHLMRLLSCVALLAHIGIGLVLLNYFINFFTTSMEIEGNLMMNGWRRIRRVLVQSVGTLVQILPAVRSKRRILHSTMSIWSFVTTACKRLIYIFIHLIVLAVCLMMLGTLVGMGVALSDMRPKDRGFGNGVLFVIVLIPIAVAFPCYLGFGVWVVYSMFNN